MVTFQTFFQSDRAKDLSAPLYIRFCGHVLELTKSRKLRISAKIFQRPFLLYLTVKYTLKSLTFLSDIPICTAIGSIMSVVIFMVNVRRKYVEANVGRREGES